MPRINPVVHESATGKGKELLDAVKSKLGFVPNMMATMAQGPAVLEGYLSLSGALGHGSLSGKVREQIALAVAEANTCDYCASAHSAIGAQLGLKQGDVDAARRGEAADPKVSALLILAQRLVRSQGRLTDVEISKARAAGVTDGELLEVVANVALNIFTNYVNHVSDPAIDFPVVKTGH